MRLAAASGQRSQRGGAVAQGFESRPHAIRLRSAAPPMGLPSSWMFPETRCAFPLSLMRLASTLSSDVLPAPEGPIIAQVLPPPSEPDTPLRICFSFLLVPTPYLTSAHVNVDVIGATLTRCTSLVRPCSSLVVDVMTRSSM